MSESLEEILSGNEKVESSTEEVSSDTTEEQAVEGTNKVETTSTEAVEPQSAEDKADGDSEPEEKKEEDQEKEPQETSEKEETWTKKAALDERRKRQEKERELEKVQNELARLRESKQKEEQHQDNVDFYDDPEGFRQQIRNEMMQELSNTRTDISRNMMMQAHDDYEEAELKFFDIAKENPLLKQQAAQHSHPAQFVYEQVKKHEEFQQIQDGTYQEKLRAEIKKQVEQEHKASQEEKASKVANLSPSLANESSSDKQDQTSIKTVDQLFAS